MYKVDLLFKKYFSLYKNDNTLNKNNHFNSYIECEHIGCTYTRSTFFQGYMDKKMNNL